MSAPLTDAGQAPGLPAELIAAAAAARRRLIGRAFASRFAAQAPVAAGVLIAVIVAAVLGAPSGLLVLGVLPVWLVLLIVVVLRQAPTPMQALARWDAAADRSDDLLNAWSFALAPPQGPAAVLAALHTARVTAALPAWRAELSRHLPLPMLPVLRSSAALALCAGLILAGAASAPLRPGDERVDAATARALAAETAALARDAKALAIAAALKTDERKAAEDLQRRIAEAASAAERDGGTSRAALEALDRLAAQAESLAAQLVPLDLGTAKLTLELGAIADFAALSEALAASDLKLAAEEAKALADALRNGNASLEEQRRMAQSLAAAAAAAQGQAGALAKALAAAESAMQGGDRAGAAAALEHLAKELADAGQRQAAGEAAQRLAQDLRGAGDRLFAGAPAGAPAAEGQQAPRGRGAPPRANPWGAKKPDLAQPGNPGARGAAPAPGRKQQPAGGAQGGPGGQGGGPGGAGGQGQAKTPVPGSKPNQNGGGAGGGGNDAGPPPVPGSAAARAGMAKRKGGGSKPGTGHVPGSQAPTKAQGPTAEQTTDAVMGDHGESTTSVRDGAPHREAAAVAQSAAPLAQIDAAEAALAAEPLPLARRQQVKQYFQLLRQTLESP